MNVIANNRGFEGRTIWSMVTQRPAKADETESASSSLLGNGLHALTQEEESKLLFSFK